MEKPVGPLGPPPLNEDPQPIEQPSTVATPQLIKSTQPVEVPPEDTVEDEPDILNEHVDDPGDPDGLIAADEAQKMREEQAEDTAIEPKTRKKRRWPLILVVLLIIAGLLGAVYWFVVRDSQTSTSEPTPTAQTPTEEKSTPTEVPVKHYDSTIYTLSFDYPQDWIVSDTAERLTVTSPATDLKTSGGATTSGHVVVSIQNQQTTIPGYPSAGAVAALTSEKLTYTHPSSVQRAQTYLTYLSYHTPTDLNALYITGDNGYQQGQQIPMSDVVKSNPLIAVHFQACDTTCSSASVKPLTLSAASWQSSAVAKQVTDLLQSIVLN